MSAQTKRPMDPKQKTVVQLVGVIDNPFAV